MSAALQLTGARPIAAADAALVDVTVRDGRIERIVPADRERPPADAEVVALDGRFLGPGLADEHVHLTQWALARERLDVSAARSAAETRAIVRDALAGGDRRGEDRRGDVLVGVGFRDALWPDAPAPGMLEAGDAAVVLISADLHCVWVNRAALAALGRPGPDGLLREQTAYDIASAVSALPDDVVDRAVDRALAAAAARGVTRIADFEMADAPGAWRRRLGRGDPPLRVAATVYPDLLDAAIDAGLRTGDALEPAADARARGGARSGAGVGRRAPGEPDVTVGPLKLFADGSLNTRTAFCRMPYAELEPRHGTAAYDRDELIALVARGYAAGLAPAIHAIGDAGNALALDAIEAVGCAARIEHAQLLAPEDIRRFRALGVTASVQPEHAMDDREVADRLWASRTQDAYPLASLAAAGVRMLFGSDAPVAPLDPWVALSAAVFRSRDGLAPWHPEQRLAFGDAWRASTVAAGLSVGAAADLVIVDEDPATADADALRRMPVAATLVGGEFTYRAF